MLIEANIFANFHLLFLAWGFECKLSNFQCVSNRFARRKYIPYVIIIIVINSISNVKTFSLAFSFVFNLIINYSGQKNTTRYYPSNIFNMVIIVLDKFVFFPPKSWHILSPNLLLLFVISCQNSQQCE